MKKVKGNFLVFIVAAGVFAALAGCSSSSSDGESLSGPAAVDLGGSGGFAILAKTAISNTPTSSVTGDIGVSPVAETAITGFAQARDSSNTFSTSDQVTGKVYAADMSAPTPDNLTAAIQDMETAYLEAAGRTDEDFTDIGVAGDIGGMTLTPGLYKWGTAVSIPTSITLSGNGVFIFQIVGALTVGNSVNVILSGGAQAGNVFWQVTGATSLGTGSQFKGTILGLTSITLGSGTTLDGRMLAQTAVTLNQNSVTKP